MRVYISGPITNCPGHYRKFLRAERRLKAAGHEVINPAKIGRLLPKSFDCLDYLDIEYEMIKKCDAIFFLKGWEKSSGACAEHAFASKYELKMVFEKREEVLKGGGC